MTLTVGKEFEWKPAIGDYSFIYRVVSGPHADISGKTYFVVDEVRRRGIRGKHRKNVVFHVPQP